MQEYIVDAYGKTEYEKLLFHRNNQKKIRADLYNGLMDAVRDNDGVRGNAVGMPIILPSSFVGGARSMREKYQVSDCCQHMSAFCLSKSACYICTAMWGLNH